MLIKDCDSLKLPFVRRLLAGELEYWRRVVTIIRDYDGEDKNDFALIFRTCLPRCLTPQQVADEFRVSKATVSRWLRGKSTPPEYSRKNIILRIRQLILTEVEQAAFALQRAS